MEQITHYLISGVIALAVLLTLFFYQDIIKSKMNQTKWLGTILMVLGGVPFFFYMVLSPFGGGRMSSRLVPNSLSNLNEMLERWEDQNHIPFRLIAFGAFFLGLIIVYIGDSANRKAENARFKAMKVPVRVCPVCLSEHTVLRQLWSKGGVINFGRKLMNIIWVRLAGLLVATILPFMIILKSTDKYIEINEDVSHKAMIPIVSLILLLVLSNVLIRFYAMDRKVLGYTTLAFLSVFTAFGWFAISIHFKKNETDKERNVFGYRDRRYLWFISVFIFIMIAEYIVNMVTNTRGSFPLLAMLIAMGILKLKVLILSEDGVRVPRGYSPPIKLTWDKVLGVDIDWKKKTIIFQVNKYTKAKIRLRKFEIEEAKAFIASKLPPEKFGAGFKAS
jgi:hypothetical protein